MRCYFYLLDSGVYKMLPVITKLHHVISKIDKAIIWASYNTAALLLAFASVLVFYQVLTRFLLGDSATWTEILARGIIVWVVFLGSAATFRQGAMISIMALAGALPIRANLWVQRGVTLLVLIFLWVLVWYGYLMTVRVSHQTISMIEISMAWFYAAIPIGSACAMIAVLTRHLEIEMNPAQAAEITFEEAEGLVTSSESRGDIK